MVRQYNEEMNSTRPREYDGSHITFGGMNPAITLREHQKSAIAHVLYGELGIWSNQTENQYYRRIYHLVSAKIMPKIWTVAGMMLRCV